MITLPTTSHCSENKGVATFDCSFLLPAVVGDRTASEVYLVGHYLGTSFRVDHKTFSLSDAISYMNSTSVVFCVEFHLSKIF